MTGQGVSDARPALIRSWQGDVIQTVAGFRMLEQSWEAHHRGKGVFAGNRNQDRLLRIDDGRGNLCGCEAVGYVSPAPAQVADT